MKDTKKFFRAAMALILGAGALGLAVAQTSAPPAAESPPQVLTRTADKTAAGSPVSPVDEAAPKADRH